MRLVRYLLVAWIACLAAACSVTNAPSPTAGSMDDVIAQIVLQDVTVHRLTSGDAGCPTSSVHDNAVHLELVIGAQSAAHDVYLLRWRNQADYADAAPDFAACVDEYRALHMGARVTTLESPPWRAYGPSLEGPIGAIVLNALRAAGGAPL